MPETDMNPKFLSKDEMTEDKELYFKYHLHNFMRGGFGAGQRDDEYYCTICGVAELDTYLTPKLVAYVRAKRDYEKCKDGPFPRDCPPWHRWIEERGLDFPEDASWWTRLELYAMREHAQTLIRNQISDELEQSGRFNFRLQVDNQIFWRELNERVNEFVQTTSDEEKMKLLTKVQCKATYHGEPCPKMTYEVLGFCPFHRRR